MSDLREWLRDEVASAATMLQRGVLDLVPAERMAETVDGGGVPPLYVLWHATRHHDVAVNAVVRGESCVLDDHASSVGVDRNQWRGLSESTDVELVDTLDVTATITYATATLERTQRWLADEATDLGDLDRVPDTDAALERLGTPRDDFGWLYGMWADKPLRWFLSWPMIGHVVTHTGELVSLRNRMGLSPF